MGYTGADDLTSTRSKEKSKLCLHSRNNQVLFMVDYLPVNQVFLASFSRSYRKLLGRMWSVLLVYCKEGLPL